MEDKIWLIGEPDDIIEVIRVRDKKRSFSIDVCGKDTFILSVDGDDLMAFDKEEMRKIYNFLQRFYE